MSRAQVFVEHGKFPKNLTAGASVQVNIAGKGQKVAGTLYADRTSSATLSNPFTVPAAGIISFWMAQQQDVDLAITPAGGSTSTVMNATVSSSIPTHQPMTSPAGKVVNWTSMS